MSNGRFIFISLKLPLLFFISVRIWFETGLQGLWCLSILPICSCYGKILASTSSSAMKRKQELILKKWVPWVRHCFKYAIGILSLKPQENPKPWIPACYKWGWENLSKIQEAVCGWFGIWTLIIPHHRLQ